MWDNDFGLNKKLIQVYYYYCVLLVQCRSTCMMESSIKTVLCGKGGDYLLLGR